MSEPTAFRSAIDWIRAGYPAGVNPTDFPPLLALLLRVLDEDQAREIAFTIISENPHDEPVSEQQIRDAISAAIQTDPNTEEIAQVASRLAAVGWPLDSNVRAV